MCPVFMLGRTPRLVPAILSSQLIPIATVSNQKKKKKKSIGPLSRTAVSKFLFEVSYFYHKVRNCFAMLLDMYVSIYT